MRIQDIGKNQKGTTLMELVVALVLFATAMLSATQIFNMVMKVQRTALISQNIQSDMRYLTEVITKEMRMAEVDKSGFCITKDKVYETDGESLEFVNSNNKCVKYEVVDGNFKITRGVGDTKVVTSQDTIIKDINFEQYGEVPASQPQLTINMDIKLAGGGGTKEKEINFQTTISTRHYE